MGLAALMAGAAGAAVPAWTSYDHDGGRSATDPDSGAPVGPTAAWGPVSVDGDMYAQPLVSGSEVVVATENDSVYALNAATGAVLWQRSLGTPVPSGDLPCGDIAPTVGITSTPAIDPSTGRIYAVADVLSGSAVNHELFALDTATGAIVAGFPVAVDPPGSDHTALLQRASLALDAGRVIIPYGGNSGDCSTYHGWLVSVAQDGSGTPTTFEVNAAAGEHGGAIWGRATPRRWTRRDTCSSRPGTASARRPRPTSRSPWSSWTPPSTSWTTGQRAIGRRSTPATRTWARWSPC
jgi:outer membrane protein assembly factor BamB